MSMPALSQHSLSVPRSGIRDVFDRVEHVPDAISLCVGEPSATAAPHIVEAACRSIREGHTTYTNVLGIEPFREAVAAYSEKVKGLRYDVDTEIQAVDGATIGLFLAMKALLDAGDEVILPSPYFTSYDAEVLMCGGAPVPVALKPEHQMRLNADDIEAAITPRTKAIIFNNPTNPTGMGYDLSTMEMLARVAKEYDLLIAADEIYTTYIYEGDFRPIRTLPGMAERTITLNSFSKNFLMTGWRVGVIIAEPEFLDVMNRINGSLVYSAPSISQRAGIQALAMRKEIREKYVTAYRDRIFYSADRIEKIPYLSLVRPKGTFYLFPGVEKTGLDDKQFCKELLERAHVLVSAGSPFGKTGANHFRIACTVGIDQLKQAFDRMEKLEF